MNTVGIICEYNPFHLGHRKQIRHIKERFGEECAVICLMSGNFVQRGHPAIFDKSLRAKAAVLCGADLVLELPVTVALSSAEGFASGGVRILSKLCDGLCFGSESGNRETLQKTASALLSRRFSEKLRFWLDTGLSFPVARSRALEDMEMDASLLEKPNDILAVEYCKAILEQNVKMDILPIQRGGSYHDVSADAENPSATAVRMLLQNGEAWKRYVPEEAAAVFENAPIHTLQAGERAMLAKFRTMTDAEFEVLPFGGEGLWRKFMHNCRNQATLEAVLTETKSKRYTRTRLDRMAMCAFLGIDASAMDLETPYVRILAFSELGRKVLNEQKNSGYFRNAGEPASGICWELEKRCGDLYGLFSESMPEAPAAEENRRIFYKK